MKKKLLSMALAMVIVIANTMVIKAEESWDYLDCKSALLIEETTGKVLLAKNPSEKLAPASITKIMTLLLIMEAIESSAIAYDDMVTISPEAKILGGSEIWLEIGEQMSVDDLVKAIIVASANDASVAMAEYISGSEAEFVKAMNVRAGELGMVNTNFMNSHGLDEEGHYTTAVDIGIMTMALLKYPKITQYSSIWMDSLRNGETQLVNTNKLVRYYTGATGLKTGTTENAGHCLVATAERGNLSLIGITLGSESSAGRFDTAWQVLDYGFANYLMVDVPTTEEVTKDIKVLGGKENTITPQLQLPEFIIAKTKDKDSFTTQVELWEDLKAPVEQGQIIGKGSIMLGEEVYEEFDVIAPKSIEKLSVFDGFIRLWAMVINV